MNNLACKLIRLSDCYIQIVFISLCVEWIRENKGMMVVPLGWNETENKRTRRPQVYLFTHSSNPLHTTNEHHHHKSSNLLDIERKIKPGILCFALLFLFVVWNKKRKESIPLQKTKRGACDLFGK